MGKTAAPNVCILCELRIICPDLSIPEKEAQDDTLAKQIAFVQDLNLEELHTIPEVKQFFAYPSHALNSLKATVEYFRGAARGSITDFLASDEGWRADKEFTVVSIGASFLLAFIQSCWTGVDIEDLEKAAFNYLSIGRRRAAWADVAEYVCDKAKSHLAIESGLIFSFYGDMEEAKANLLLKAESAFIDDKKDSAAPATLALNDDTLLESIEFTTPKDVNDIAVTGNLNPFDQMHFVIILLFILNVKNENPEDGITTEQMVPTLRELSNTPTIWTIHTMALLLRSRLESKKGRTVERSALQLQALVDQIPSKDSTAAERVKFFFSVMEPPKWDLERELGERFISMVLFARLEIFERLQMWDDVVSCLQMLGKAKRLKGLSLGAHFFREGNFEESVECYKKGLAINPLFENSWFVMGCAALRAQDWESAEEAFRRTISLDHNNGEAWTNLASVYVRKNLKREAGGHSRSSPPTYDNSKIWDNYLLSPLTLASSRNPSAHAKRPRPPHPSHLWH
ncbi:hypothetical protein BC829DRAFT_416213 [Chytridium lagenaria]|nr:hypothetical protein BC829DRAFT_416213 [Chytridium lagenaria]